ncbi:MarR family transcriptional regulator [Vulcanisaeta distributa]|uniref:Transcriptional repressor, CopY family n=1 Tax=Vulcanisaeta distributa (strain DSM 14429 / JCM 11212 / NBRC 100878 / IC-017) TaxID=572478 RepID=E1QSS0_VULDI|nr:helix-turn-helix domain-containing protein [Vulcanisaeta distributa]ADN49587.1 transcriptional repressor, CopY family [Vulcanisaeta distributa DSM 14429]
MVRKRAGVTSGLRAQEIDVLDYLSSKPSDYSASFKEIFEFLHKKYSVKSKGTVGRLLERLVKADLIERSGKGIYKLKLSNYSAIKRTLYDINNQILNELSYFKPVILPRDLGTLSGMDLLLSRFETNAQNTNKIINIINAIPRVINCKYLAREYHYNPYYHQNNTEYFGLVILGEAFASSYENIELSEIEKHEELFNVLKQGGDGCRHDGSNLYIYSTTELKVDSSIVKPVKFVTMVILNKGFRYMGVVSSATYGDEQLSDGTYESIIRLLIMISLVNTMKFLSLFRLFSNNVIPRSMIYTESRKGFIHYIPFTQGYDLTKLINTIMKIENLEPSNVPNTLLTLTKEPH